MKTLLKLAVIPAAGFVAYKLYKGISASKVNDNLITDFSRVVWKGLSGELLDKKLNLDLLMSNTNPTNLSMTIEQMNLDVLLDSDKLARIDSTTPYNVPAQVKDSIQTIPVSIPAKDLGLSLITKIVNYISTKTLPNKVTIKGTVKVNGFTTDYNKEIPLQTN